MFPATESVLVIVACHLWCSEPGGEFLLQQRASCRLGAATVWQCQARVAGFVFQGAAESSDCMVSPLGYFENVGRKDPGSLLICLMYLNLLNTFFFKLKIQSCTTLLLKSQI